MKEELEKIGIELTVWCKKYNENYASTAYLDGVLMANIDVKDEDYKKTKVFINEKGVEKICSEELKKNKDY